MQTKEFNKDLPNLIALAKSGDRSAQEKIVDENMGLVYSIVKRFSGRGYEVEDLFQIGCMGLVKSIQKFDESFDVKFSTYAVPMIIGEIKRFMRDDGIIKVSRSIKELAIKALALREKLQNETNAEPSIKELAERLGVSAEEVAIAMEAGIRPESINAPLGDNSDKTLADRIESHDDCEGKVLNRILVSELLKMFDERDKKIIILRYFKQKTQVEVAEALGISQVQVSRLEKKVLSKMRTYLEEEN